MTAPGPQELMGLGDDSLAVKRIRATASALLAALTALVITFVIPSVTDVVLPRWPVVLLAVLAVGVSWWWTGVEHARWAWRLTEDLLEVRRGVLVRRTHLIPRSRIQNVTTVAGPLQSRYGVLTLTVHTAGARTRNVSIEDLDIGHAAAIRRRLGLQ